MGFDQPDLPYDVGYFVESKWGAKLEVDFNKVPEKTMTIARVDPRVRKVLAFKAEIDNCTGLGVPGCSLRINCKCRDTKSLHRKAVDYGFHFADVLGDYTQEIGQLAELLGMEAEFHHV